MECEVTSGQFCSCSLHPPFFSTSVFLCLCLFFPTSVGRPEPPCSLSLCTLKAGRKEIAYTGTRNWYRGFFFFIAALMLQAAHYWSPNKTSNLIYYIQCSIHFRNNIMSVIYFKQMSGWSTIVRFVLCLFLVLFLQNKNSVELSPPPPVVSFCKPQWDSESRAQYQELLIIQLLWKTMFSREDLRGGSYIYNAKGFLFWVNHELCRIFQTGLEVEPDYANFTYDARTHFPDKEFSEPCAPLETLLEALFDF